MTALFLCVLFFSSFCTVRSQCTLSRKDALLIIDVQNGFMEECLVRPERPSYSIPGLCVDNEREVKLEWRSISFHFYVNIQVTFFLLMALALSPERLLSPEAVK